MSINLLIYNFKVLTQRPVMNQLKLMQTKTSLKTTKRLQTMVFCGPVRFFWLLGKGRLVMVTVKAPQHQKTGPDRTFKHYAYISTTTTPIEMIQSSVYLSRLVLNSSCFFSSSHEVFVFVELSKPHFFTFSYMKQGMRSRPHIHVKDVY